MTLAAETAEEGPRGDLQRAIRSVQSARTAGLALAVILALVGFLRDGEPSSASPVEFLLTAILGVAGFMHAQVCGLRIDAFKRELRGLPTL